MSTATTTAAVLRVGKTRELAIEERSFFPPMPHQVTVQIVSTGLCGSDLHYFEHGRNGDFKVRQDIVLGHEAGGIVTAVGSSVTNVLVGQRVAIEAGIYCRSCEFCKSGRYNLCKQMKFCSSASVLPHNDGTLQTKMNHPAFVVHPLPDACTFEHAALAEPLSVLIHATRRARFEPGHTALVYGVGTIGLLACALAKAKGAKRVVAVDINPSRLEFALQNGFASHVHCLERTTDDEPATLQEKENQLMQRAKDGAQKLLSVFNAQQGFDVVYECTGAQPCIQMSIHTAVTGGKVMLIGMGSRNVLLPLSAAACREVDIHGCFRYCNTYPAALELLASGKLQNIDRIVTHRFPLEESQRAFELMMKGRDEHGRLVIKVMVDSAPSSS
ncbi:NADP(H)-dependent ketose reductase [Coprinopsis marcescibilis]|uniref:NADP(H)-dependent ketose reductase n=1 Tax=Coprinopsis marcescibilis TaxID=230819 RepID=A0A5C3KMU1_COPMA|nr:NADP(H)-dependent ketose reductase [Coprinopsis marcescibilis]